MSDLLKNITQTKQFDAGLLLTIPTPQNIKADLYSAYTNLSGAELTAKLDEIAQNLPNEIKKGLEQFGATLPTDKINLTVSLSSFLFDLYTNGMVIPEAPLRRKAMEKKIQDLAVALDKPEFPIPLEFIQPMLDIMADDKKIKGMHITAWVTMPEGSDPKEVFTQINWEGAKLFGAVVSAAEDALFPYFQE
jgi:hypothetical protein